MVMRFVDVNLDGTASVTNYSDQTNGEPPTIATSEPGSLMLFASGLTILIFAGLMRRMAPFLILRHGKRCTSTVAIRLHTPNFNDSQH